MFVICSHEYNILEASSLFGGREKTTLSFDPKHFTFGIIHHLRYTDDINNNQRLLLKSLAYHILPSKIKDYLNE